jgi:hypothetical protein
MQHEVLEKTKVLKTQRDSKSELRKPKFYDCAEIVSPVIPVLHTGQTSAPCPRASLILQTCLVFLLGSKDIYWTFSVLDQIRPVNNMTVGIWTPTGLVRWSSNKSGSKTKWPNQRFSFRECPEPVGGHPIGLTGMMDLSDRSGLTTQWLVFSRNL